MELSQAIEHASAYLIPGFLNDDATLTAERLKNEDALKTLLDAWNAAPKDSLPFSFDLVRQLADRNREVCDLYGSERLRNVNGVSLARGLTIEDTARGVAKLQHRRETAVMKTAGPTLADLALAYHEKPVSGTILGIDIETTSRFPDQGYIINIGFEFWNLGSKTVPVDPHAAYFGMPELYREKGVPLSEIHHITWQDLDGRPLFRSDKAAQKALLTAMKKVPFMAHNAAFEDSWFMLHIDGYAEARKEGKIVPIDTREICRRLDPEFRSLLPASRPASLENWARRRGTLAAHEVEQHLGLDDVDLMIRTVQAELNERNMFKAS